MVRVNVLGTLYTVKAALLHMLDGARGHIVVISSGAGLRAFPWGAVYGATKAADKNFAEALRHELSGTGVSVTTVYPGEIATDIHRAGATGFRIGGPMTTSCRRRTGGRDRRGGRDRQPRRLPAAPGSAARLERGRPAPPRPAAGGGPRRIGRAAAGLPQRPSAPSGSRETTAS